LNKPKYKLLFWICQLFSEFISVLSKLFFYSWLCNHNTKNSFFINLYVENFIFNFRKLQETLTKPVKCGKREKDFSGDIF